MATKRGPEWGGRLRKHIRASGKKMGEIAELMDVAESTLRSWMNGTREINLSEFEALCAICEADSCTILVGRPALTDKEWGALRVLTPRFS